VISDIRCSSVLFICAVSVAKYFLMYFKDFTRAIGEDRLETTFAATHLVESPHQSRAELDWVVQVLGQ